MLRTSVSPNIFTGGYRVNVIPSEARATLDVRALPDEDPDAFLAQVEAVVADSSIEVKYATRSSRPPGVPTALDSELFDAVTAAITEIYRVPTIPMLLTGATDKAQLRARGMQCVGIGPAIDHEDGPKGFGAHSDQERLLEAELHRFVRFNWEVVTRVAAADRLPGD
jgi:acetylornithine deacetylase/succinyl-diaminopimelate desuccinylase-like protein